jgi:hypothetical protein
MRRQKSHMRAFLAAALGVNAATIAEIGRRLGPLRSQIVAA